MRILERKTSSGFSSNSFKIPFGPFNSFSQRRWRKPVVTAQTRLEDRTRDSKLDKLTTHLRKLKIVLHLHQLMSSRKRGPFVSIQLMSRWRNIVGLNVGIGEFIHKHPHVFDVFTHPTRKNLCCRTSQQMSDLIKQEENAINEMELDAVRRLKKLLMMSVNGTLHIHALGLFRRELGLPIDFRESILEKYSSDFKLIGLEIVELVYKDENLGVAEIEKWREKEYNDKWLSEFETKYSFPINFPTGFRIEGGFREKLKNWQRLPYLKPYDRKEVIRIRTCGGKERYEKRVVGILHELLSLTVEKMVEVDRLVHFRKDLGIEVNMRELLLKHPGIFYISTKGNTLTVFLRESYDKGCLVEPNPIYVVRRKMMDLVLLGSRNTRELQAFEDVKNERNNVVVKHDWEGKRDGDWVVSIFERSDGRNN